MGALGPKTNLKLWFSVLCFRFEIFLEYKLGRVGNEIKRLSMLHKMSTWSDRKSLIREKRKLFAWNQTQFCIFLNRSMHSYVWHISSLISRNSSSKEERNVKIFNNMPQTKSEIKESDFSLRFKRPNVCKRTLARERKINLCCFAFILFFSMDVESDASLNKNSQSWIVCYHRIYVWVVSAGTPAHLRKFAYSIIPLAMAAVELDAFCESREFLCVSFSVSVFEII